MESNNNSELSINNYSSIGIDSIDESNDESNYESNNYNTNYNNNNESLFYSISFMVPNIGTEYESRYEVFNRISDRIVEEHPDLSIVSVKGNPLAYEDDTRPFRGYVVWIEKKRGKTFDDLRSSWRQYVIYMKEKIPQLAEERALFFDRLNVHLRGGRRVLRSKRVSSKNTKKSYKKRKSLKKTIKKNMSKGQLRKKGL